MIRSKEDLCKHWKHCLGLSDWRIKFKIEQKRDDLELESVCGEVVQEKVSKTALIRIIKESEYPDDCIIPFDFEKTLVHELLHIKFGIVNEMAETVAEDLIIHKLIDELAIILVDNYHSRKIVGYEEFKIAAKAIEGHIRNTASGYNRNLENDTLDARFIGAYDQYKHESGFFDVEK